ncbi:hypothetical protein [Streptomyces sp. NPDC091217]|uniref:hypothetical protein n=1 Tax=Streptomyces sp. NPDC091217 TaxID=3365975 RepID=UPI00381B1E44
MADPLSFAGLAGALLCLAGHLPGSVRRPGLHLPALTGMVLMVGGRPLAGACVTWAGCLRGVGRACRERPGWTGAVDLAVITLLMAPMTGGRTHRHLASTTVGPVVPTVVVRVTARAGGIMFRSLPDRRVPCAGRLRACREAGALLMVVAMAAMLV